MKKIVLSLSLLAALTVQATEMKISVELPEHEYEGRFYPPFVTAWVEKDHKMLGTLFIWSHKDKNSDSVNVEWVKGLKKWWRRGGREVDLTTLDAVTGATKEPGTHIESFTVDNETLAKLEKGITYKLVIEASRQKGGNEAIDIPFTLDGSALEITAKGKEELGAVTINVMP